jgi:hypothetical protein
MTVRSMRARFPLTIASAVWLFAAPAGAQEAPVAPAPPAPAEAPDRKAMLHPVYVHASYGVNAVTHTWASGKTPDSTTTPADKVIQFEQVGVGYWVHPHVRLQLTAMFGETLTGLKPGASSFTLGAVIPCVFYTSGGFAAGVGPLFAPRAFGTDDFNVGVFSVASYALKLGRGVSLALAVQVPVMVKRLYSVAVTPAVVLGERF